MRKAFLLTLILTIISLVIVSYFYFSERVYPGTYLGKKNISFLKKTDISAYLEKSFEYSFNIQVRNRAYPMKYKQMGIILDKGASERLIFESNRLPFPHNITTFFRSINGKKMILPGLIFSENFS